MSRRPLISNPEERNRIKLRYAVGASSMAQIAAHYGVSADTIGRLVQGIKPRHRLGGMTKAGRATVAASHRDGAPRFGLLPYRGRDPRLNQIRDHLIEWGVA